MHRCFAVRAQAARCLQRPPIRLLRSWISCLNSCFEAVGLGRGRSQCGSMTAMPTIDFVIPVFNEQESLPEFHKLLDETVLPAEYSKRFVYVNDGSTDRTPAVLDQFA